MMVAVECAKAATTYAAWAIDQQADDAAIAAATAKATANDTYRLVTAKAIQLHGGIGFTWEHDLHIYYKRAMASEPTFGDSAWNRELVASRLGLVAVDKDCARRSLGVGWGDASLAQQIARP